MFYVDKFFVQQVSCLKWILNQKFGGSPAILCGDFNMSPDSPQYIFTTEGTLSEKQWDLLREIAKIEVMLSHIHLVGSSFFTNWSILCHSRDVWYIYSCACISV